MIDIPETLTTREALAYLAQKTGKPGGPYHKKHLNLWQRQGRIAPHIQGTMGRQNTYTIESLDVLAATIKVEYRRNT